MNDPDHRQISEEGLSGITCKMPFPGQIHIAPQIISKSVYLAVSQRFKQIMAQSMDFYQMR